MKNTQKVKFIGKCLLIVGLVCLLAGLVFLLLTGSRFALWSIVASIIVNIIAITMLTMKVY